jgi:hypothetical protein
MKTIRKTKEKKTLKGFRTLRTKELLQLRGGLAMKPKKIMFFN